MNIVITKCPFEIGQEVEFAEISHQARGIITGLIWEPSNWLLPGWVAIVRCYAMPDSPWLDLPIEEEIHCSELRPVK